MIHVVCAGNSFGVQAGAKINERRLRDGWTPLFLAAIFGNVKVVRYKTFSTSYALKNSQCMMIKTNIFEKVTSIMASYCCFKIEFRIQKERKVFFFSRTSFVHTYIHTLQIAVRAWGRCSARR